MKAKYTLTACALLLGLQAQANPISRREARQVAQQFVGINDATTDNVSNAPYYIFSRGAGKGYVIASGDDETAPIVGYTDQGDYDPAHLPDGLKNLLASWTKKVEALQQTQKTRTRKVARRSVAQRLQVPTYKSTWTDVQPLVKTHWSQGYPYNMLAPHRSDNGQQALSGCEATAASQIVYYFRRDNPDTLLYATPTYNEGWFHAPVTMSLPAGTPVRYDLMKLSGTGSLQQDSAVAVLMYAVGTCAHLGYGYQDGTATAGNTDKMGESISGQFALANDYVGKWNYSQQGWENLIYSNVRSGRPLLYSGANDSQGGHAVVLDGYQASTGLYHFNFGWGGQADGYYTVDDSTGMNGFSSGQAALANITPKRQNLSGHLDCGKMYYRTEGQVVATLKNEGTLAYRGVYLYCSYSKNMPTTATAYEMTTYTASGDSATFSFTYRPTQNKRLYLWLTDANKNILDTLSVEVNQSVADLHLGSISVEASATTLDHDGIRYQQINDNRAIVAVSLTNGANGSYCQPVFTCQLDSLNGTTGEWDKCATRAVNKLTFEVGQTRDTTLVFTGLQENRYYRASMVKRVNAGLRSDMIFDTPDSIVYFVAKNPTLTITAQGRTATVTGDWSATRFTEQARDAAVTAYDMTAVAELASQPEAANPNALFFTTAPITGAKNIVAGGVCDSLEIHTAHEFATPTAFTASKAVLVLDSARAGQWGDVVMPFAAQLPYGMQGRVVTEVLRSRLTVTNVREVEAMAPLLYLTDHDALRTIEASNVTLSTDTTCARLDGLWRGSTLRTTLSRDAGLLTPTATVPAYMPTDKGTVLPPFATELDTLYRLGYRISNTSDVSVDRNYMALADTINLAYQVIAQYGEGARAYLADSLQKSEDIFTYYTYSGSQYPACRKAYENLGKTIRAFLADPVANAIHDVVVSDETRDDADAPVVYYSIDGQRLTQPQRGIVIVKKGRKTWKMTVR